jgi:hypothetical protein
VTIDVVRVIGQEVIQQVAEQRVTFERPQLVLNAGHHIQPLALIVGQRQGLLDRFGFSEGQLRRRPGVRLRGRYAKGPQDGERLLQGHDPALIEERIGIKIVESIRSREIGQVFQAPP